VKQLEYHPSTTIVTREFRFQYADVTVVKFINVLAIGKPTGSLRFPLEAAK
jgi:hypothetical protein